MGALLLKLFLTNILFSLIIGALLVRLNKKGEYPTVELVLYSLGLGPVFTVLILYYLLLLIPRQTHLFYLAGIFLVYLLLFLGAGKGFQRIFGQMKEFFKIFRAVPGTAIYWCMLLVVLVGVLSLYPVSILKTPVEGHDALIYGNLGKTYYHERQVPYEKVMKPRQNGFYFQGSTKPSFSLLLTWEMMLNSGNANQSQQFDLYFRSISGYYGLLIIAVVFLWLYRKNKFLALLGILVLLSGLRFFLMLVDYHLDSYRIFFLLVSWIWLAYTIKKRDHLSFFLLGVFSGFMAFTHVIGLVAALVNGLAFLIFAEQGFLERTVKTAAFFGLTVVFGGVHYLLEALYGSVSGFLTYISF